MLGHLTSFENINICKSNRPKRLVNYIGIYIKDRQYLSIKRGTEEEATDVNIYGKSTGFKCFMRKEINQICSASRIHTTWSDEEQWMWTCFWAWSFLPHLTLFYSEQSWLRWHHVSSVYVQPYSSFLSWVQSSILSNSRVKDWNCSICWRGPWDAIENSEKFVRGPLKEYDVVPQKLWPWDP